MTEQTDAAEGLTEAEKDALWEAVERAFLDVSTYSKAAVLDAEHAIARIIAAREAAAEVRGAQAALLEAADALNVEAVGFKPEGWGSNDADRQTIDVLRQAVDWLRARAAAAAAGGGAS